MSAAIEHRMSYVRDPQDVGESLVRRVKSLDDLAARYNDLADQLQALVVTFWTPEERRAAQHCRLHGRLPDVF